MAEEVRYELMRPQQIIAARARASVAYIPIGPMEWQGPHTTTAAERLRPRGFTGTERICGMDYPGFSLPSLYIEESAMGVIVHEIIRALKRQEFRVIVITNGHGATNHRATLQRIAVEQS